MSYFPIRRFAMLAILLPALSGCGYFFQTAETDVDDEEFAEVEPDKKAEKPSVAEETARAAPENELELKLKVGDQFPLIKRVDQNLTQSEAQGVSFNQMHIEMLLSLRVEDIRDGKRLLSVRYHRVQYSHNIAGKKIEYNSDFSDRAPVEALAYAGLKDNFFSFWIGPDHRVIELVGFSDFLQRCLRDVPHEYREAVMKQLEATHRSEEGLANFVDDGIGLLPAKPVKVGSSWDLKTRRSEGVIPMNINTQCILRNLTDTSAEIGLTGTIGGSSTPITVQEGGRSMRVMVKGGHCSGSCTVDRRTGLPTQSKVDRSLEMSIRMPDGSEITQRKEIISSITSYLDQSRQQALTPGLIREPDVNPATRTTSYGSDIGTNRVTQAVGTSGNFDRRSEFESNRQQR